MCWELACTFPLLKRSCGCVCRRATCACAARRRGEHASAGEPPARQGARPVLYGEVCVRRCWKTDDFIFFGLTP